MSFVFQVEMHFKATDPCLSVSTTVNWNELFMHPAVASLLLITGQTPAENTNMQHLSLCAIQIILSHWMSCCIPHASQKMNKKNKKKLNAIL